MERNLPRHGMLWQGDHVLGRLQPDHRAVQVDVAREPEGPTLAANYGLARRSPCRGCVRSSGVRTRKYVRIDSSSWARVVLPSLRSA
ncbi:MAG: hypothetical protein K8R59_18065, partial [Thermoanaerobaculales bacterium]|nr:hypothetical protein [Thermoanaerobaculales bacterium]